MKETFGCDEGKENLILHAFGEMVLKTWVDSDSYTWTFALKSRSFFWLISEEVAQKRREADNHKEKRLQGRRQN